LLACQPPTIPDKLDSCQRASTLPAPNPEHGAAVRHWALLGEAPIPGTGKSLALYQGKDDFFIRLAGPLGGGPELMNTRKHGSEDALGALPCQRLANPAAARVLIGGLGMGFTLAAALKAVGPAAEVTVAELIPEVVEWNRGPLGERSGRPLDDPRTRVYVGDVAKLLRRSPARFDAIALDVDNGPEGLTRDSNDWLYSMAGIESARKALRPGGILAYWSAGPDGAFSDTLRCCGLRVEEAKVYAHGTRGARHTLWLAMESN
jgi:spermidine synthase